MKGEPQLRVPAKLSEAAAAARAACVIVDTASSLTTTKTALDRADMAAELAIAQLLDWRRELREMREKPVGDHQHIFECPPLFCEICGVTPTTLIARAS